MMFSVDLETLKHVLEGYLGTSEFLVVDESSGNHGEHGPYGKFSIINKQGDAEVYTVYMSDKLVGSERVVKE